SGALGVGTTMNVISDLETASSILVLAERRGRAAVRSSGKPGSKIGARPALIASTRAALASTPTTLNPLAAKQAAIGKPSFPSPTTERVLMLSLPPPGASHRLRREAEVPAEAPLEPPEQRSRHPAEVPGLDIAILHVVGNTIGENMFSPDVLHPESGSLEQLPPAAPAVRVSDGAPRLSLRIPGDQGIKAPSPAPAFGNHDPEDLPRVPVVHHDFYGAPRPGVATDFTDDAIRMGRVMDDAEGVHQVVRGDRQEPAQFLGVALVKLDPVLESIDLGAQARHFQ